MAKQEPKFKLYLSDGDNNQTITEGHPKLTAEEEDFASASDALAKAYSKELIEATLQSETTVYLPN